MQKTKSKINNEKSKIVDENFLTENPQGLPEIKEPSPVAVVSKIPEMETIIFRNDRDPGIPHEFHYHSATHHLGRYKLFDGHEYTLPIEIIEHLEDRKIPIYGYKKGPDGHPVMFVSSYRYNFTCKRVRDRQKAA